MSILNKLVVVEAVVDLPAEVRAMSPDEFEREGLPRNFVALSPVARAAAVRAVEPVEPVEPAEPAEPVEPAEPTEAEQAEINARNQALDEQLLAEYGTLDVRPVEPQLGEDS